MLVESLTNPKFPVTPNFTKSQELFLFAERRRVEIYWPNRTVVMLDMTYEWPNFKQFMEKCCPIFSCSERPSKLWHLSMWWRAFKQNNTKPIKITNILMQTSWFYANLNSAIYYYLLPLCWPPAKQHQNQHKYWVIIIMTSVKLTVNITHIYLHQ